MTEMVRQPILKRRKLSGKFKMHDFQREDIARLSEQDSSANWSEMGAMKTTTCEWLWDTKLRHIPNPRVLVITTKSGKGTYLESLPEVLPEWDCFVITAQRTMPVIGGKPVPVAVKLPDPLYMRPVVVVAHYHAFMDRLVIPQQKMRVVEVGGVEHKVPILNEETGLIEMTQPKLNFLMKTHWDMVVCDEAHRIKNPDSQWTKNIKKLKAQYKHVMTGTGFINNPAEVWSLLNFLYPNTYTSYWKFREKYCHEEDYSGYRKIVGIKKENEQEFRDLIRVVGVRRTMNECFPGIAEPVETVVPVELNPTQFKMYKEIRDYLSTLDSQGVPLHSPNVLSMLNRLRQICVATPKVVADYYDFKQDRRIIKCELIEPSSKLDAAMEVIEGLEWDEENRQQVVVFSNFKDPLELLKKRLDPKYDKNGKLTKEGIPYLHLHAGMNENDRYKMWHDVWTKKEHQVFLCTLAVGSESINLSSAQRAIFLDQSWSPKDNSQAIGRIYRPGQTGVAQLIYVRAEGTVDMRVLETNEEKKGWFKSIFGAAESETEDDDE
jgi:SNF2 family DNA or RNA helicase